MRTRKKVSKSGQWFKGKVKAVTGSLSPIHISVRPSARLPLPLRSGSNSITRDPHSEQVQFKRRRLPLQEGRVHRCSGQELLPYGGARVPQMHAKFESLCICALAFLGSPTPASLKMWRPRLAGSPVDQRQSNLQIGLDAVAVGDGNAARAVWEGRGWHDGERARPPGRAGLQSHPSDVKLRWAASQMAKGKAAGPELERP